MPKPYIKMSMDDFKQLIEEKIFKDHTNYINGKISYVDLDPWKNENIPQEFYDKDDREVTFGWGNVDCLDKDRKESRMGNLVGFNETTTGLTFLGIQAGSDEEWPLFAIIYPTLDGKLAGYVPTEGNVWDTDECEAYREGNIFNLRKRFPGFGFEDIDPEEDVDNLDLFYIPASVAIDIGRTLQPAEPQVEAVYYPTICAEIEIIAKKKKTLSPLLAIEELEIPDEVYKICMKHNIEIKSKGYVVHSEDGKQSWGFDWRKEPKKDVC